MVVENVAIFRALDKLVNASRETWYRAIQSTLIVATGALVALTLGLAISLETGHDPSGIWAWNWLQALMLPLILYWAAIILRPGMSWWAKARWAAVVPSAVWVLTNASVPFREARNGCCGPANWPCLRHPLDGVAGLRKPSGPVEASDDDT